MPRSYSNTALDTTLAASADASATSLVVTATTGYPAAPFALVLDPGIVGGEEVVLVTAAAGTTLTVTRGYDGTAASAHSTGATVRHAVIAGDFTDLQAADTAEAAARAAADSTNAAAIAAHAARTDNPHGVTAAQVGADATGTAAAAVSAHEANSTNVHGIVDTAQLVLRNAANSFGAFLQTILGGLRIGSAGATNARLRVDDNGAAGSSVVEIHQDDGQVWLTELYNDALSPTAPMVQTYLDEAGNFYQIYLPDDADVRFESGDATMLYLGGATGDAEVGRDLRADRDLLAGRDVTATRNVSGANLALGGKLTTPAALTFEGGASTIKLDGASDLQALAWDAAQSKYRPRTISGGGGQGATTTTADATGATDATAQLQVDMATAAAAGHKRLYLPAGTYKISLTGGVLFNTATDDIEIFGDGIGKTILQVASGTTLTADLVFFRLTGKFQQVHDLTIDGGAATTVSTFNEYGIQVYQAAFDSYVHDVECVNINGGGTAGGAGITTYQPYNQAEVSTTLGTTILAGARTVTPASMVGIYAGRTLTIGGSTETIQVTSVTATTFTATFANNHSSSDTVLGTSMGHQRALIARCIVHDSYLATGMVLNSAANIVSDCKIIRVGSSSTQHGIYVQEGQNVIDRWYIEGVGGYSIHGYIDQNTTDATGNRYVNGVSINPGTQHLISTSSAAGSSNPDIPNGSELNRYTVVANNLFRRTKGAKACAGVQVNYGGIIVGNTLEDACGTNGSAWIFSTNSGNASTIVANNILRVLNTTNNLGIIVNNNSVVTGNQIINWNNGAAIRVDGACTMQANSIHLVGGTGIMFNASNASAFNNLINASAGIPIQINNPSLTGINCKNNDIFCSGTVSWAIDFQAASFMPTASVFANNRWSGAPARVYDSSPTLIWVNNKGNLAFRGNATQTTLDEASGRLLAWPKSTNTLTALLLVKIASGVLATLGTSDTVFYGVATSTADATNNGVYVVGQLYAECPIACDGAWTAGNIGVPSGTAAGKIHDSGLTTPPASGSYVLFLDTGGSAGNARCQILKTV